MVRILILGISFLSLFWSCRDNHIDRKENPEAAPAAGRKSAIPVAVSAMELCAHFNSDAARAASKYKDLLLRLSGNIASAEPEPIDNNCCNVIINCAHTDSRDTDTLSIVIKHCIRGEVNNDTISPGKTINIHCRFIAYEDKIIRMEEVAAPE